VVYFYQRRGADAPVKGRGRVTGGTTYPTGSAVIASSTTDKRFERVERAPKIWISGWGEPHEGEPESPIF